jgi:RNA polymerase sigma-70 factor, ECF subfamily
MIATFTHERLQSAVAGTICSSALDSMAAATRCTFLFSPLMADDRKTLIQGLRQRDPELLDRLIEEYQHRLFRYLVYITGDPARAEDFFQETWIRVLERGHQYDGRHKFEAWLFTIARNLVIDWQRQKKAISLDSMLDPEEGRSIELPDEKAESPLHVYLQGESDQRVQSSLERLPVHYREVLLLRFREEMQLDEIAKIQSTPISTVKSRLYRGLEALKGLLAGGAA